MAGRGPAGCRRDWLVRLLLKRAILPCSALLSVNLRGERARPYSDGMTCAASRSHGRVYPLAGCHVTDHDSGNEGSADQR
jgi:hypothetical protein